MEAQKQLIIINGIDKTDSVASLEDFGQKYEITFSGSSRIYSYNRSKVQILPPVQTLDPHAVIFKAKGRCYGELKAIADYGAFYRIECRDGQELSFRRSEVELGKNCLADEGCARLFGYFRETAAALSLVSDRGQNLLQLQYDRIGAVSEETVLADYLNGTYPPPSPAPAPFLLYPFGINQSQKAAVENAFASRISFIQGPPGTGKTQTILNILANAVWQGKTVAVVSNNNSATKNVAEKLEKKELSFLTAFLGSAQNKARFLETQSLRLPDMTKWQLEPEEEKQLAEAVKQLTEELNAMLGSRNRIAALEQELSELRQEQFYFREYYSADAAPIPKAAPLGRLSAEKLLSLWVETEDRLRQEKKPGFFQKLAVALRYGRGAFSLLGQRAEEAIPFLQDLYYRQKRRELETERDRLQARLRDYRFEEKLTELSDKSLTLFKGALARRYARRTSRQIFDKGDFLRNAEAFTGEYPIVLSTTYSIKGTLASDFVYDYLIMDEASQVDLATGVLAFSCARSVVIVGDQKQLPNVLTAEDVKIADALWEQHSFDEKYRFSTHSLLSSASEVWSAAPSVLLREHYRCHPKIAGFFNRKFYNGELLIMTRDQGEENVLSLWKTAAGNHARGHLNRRQIDVIRREILPMLHRQGYTDVGIITPYRQQVAALQEELGEAYEVATVHKFQGREKDAIVLSSVDNVIGEFADDPNLLNVAVSRAVKALAVVISDSRENEKTNFGDLEKYIRYNDLQIIDSRIYSVFDMLYKGYSARRRAYLRKHRRVSEYDSENLAYSVIEEVLALPAYGGVDCVAHPSLSTLVRDYSPLTEREAQYASNPLTHLDFLLFSRMDKSPLLAVEIDGTAYHAPLSPQAERDALKNSVLEKCRIPLLRIRTDESGERERIVSALNRAMGNTVIE